ncbi:unnamed protein product [Malus baccata var. baccata]
MILIHSALSDDTRTVVDSVELELTNMDLKSISSRSLPDPHTLRKSSHLLGPKVLQIAWVRDPGRGDGPIHNVDANVEYCSVIKTKLGVHRILMGAEMDCCDSTNDGMRFYVELKTSHELDNHKIEYEFEKEKLLKFWASVKSVIVKRVDTESHLGTT